MHQSRDVNRAHVMPCLDRGIPEAQIMEVLGMDAPPCGAPGRRTCKEASIWRYSTLHALAARHSTTPMPMHHISLRQGLRSFF